MVTIYQTMTQKQEKDMEFKAVADEGSNNGILLTSVKSFGIKNIQGGRMDIGSFLLLRVATSRSVRSQIRPLQSTKELPDQGNAKSLPAVQLITDKAQD